MVISNKDKRALITNIQETLKISMEEAKKVFASLSLKKRKKMIDAMKAQ